jgi:glycosyltransferase involved in cell wall biosynthesis
MSIDVSVIIPTYNRLWCLPKAIESCRDTHCKAEIIVVDDGSTDGTWEWLQQQDVTSLYQPNQGQTYAINNGVAYASGKYIRFLDSDDVLQKGTIDRQFEAAEHNSAELVYSRVDLMNYETQKVTSSPELKPWDDFLEVQLSNRYGSHFLGMLFKTDMVKKTPRRPDYALREDRMFLLEYGLLEPKTLYVDGCAGYWVQHPNQMQANYLGLRSQVTNWQHLNIYKNILGRLATNGQLTEARKKAACTVLWPLAHWVAKTSVSDALEIVEWVYELDPGFVIPERGALGSLYKILGFKTTERLLRLRRSLKFK